MQHITHYYITYNFIYIILLEIHFLNRHAKVWNTWGKHNIHRTILYTLLQIVVISTFESENEMINSHCDINCSEIWEIVKLFFNFIGKYIYDCKIYVSLSYFKCP